jgi:hypothetical protein
MHFDALVVHHRFCNCVFFIIAFVRCFIWDKVCSPSSGKKQVDSHSHAVPVIDSSTIPQCSWNEMCGGQSKRCHMAIHLLIVVNLIRLLAWMIVDLLQWLWVEIANYNSFGRSVESFGLCFVFNHDKSHGVRYSSMITLGVFNFVVIPLVNYESYHTGQLLSDFNKSFYLTISMTSIMESFLMKN